MINVKELSLIELFELRKAVNDRIQIMFECGDFMSVSIYGLVSEFSDSQETIFEEIKVFAKEIGCQINVFSDSNEAEFIHHKDMPKEKLSALIGMFGTLIE